MKNETKHYTKMFSWIVYVNLHVTPSIVEINLKINQTNPSKKMIGMTLILLDGI